MTTNSRNRNKAAFRRDSLPIKAEVKVAHPEIKLIFWDLCFVLLLTCQRFSPGKKSSLSSRLSCLLLRLTEGGTAILRSISNWTSRNFRCSTALGEHRVFPNRKSQIVSPGLLRGREREHLRLPIQENSVCR